MNPPYSYEGSLAQAEEACFNCIASVLELDIGKTATIGISKGMPEAAVFDIGHLAIGDTMAFPAFAHCFRASLELYNRDRSALQGWIMRLLSTFPVNRWYNADAAVREDANVLHFRVAPETGAVSKITTTTVSNSNSGEVPTWVATVLFDVVFICDPDYVPPEKRDDTSVGDDKGQTGGEEPPPED